MPKKIPDLQKIKQKKIIELDKNKLLKQFLIPMIDLSYWIGQMNSHKYFHFDIKNDNIIYRLDTQNLYLIDFNISSNSICKLLENIYYYYVNSIINDEPIELRFYGVFSPEVNELSFIFYLQSQGLPQQLLAPPILPIIFGIWV